MGPPVPVNQPPPGCLLFQTCLTPHPPWGWRISLAGKRVLPTGGASSMEAPAGAKVQLGRDWQALTRPMEAWRFPCVSPPSRASGSQGPGPQLRDLACEQEAGTKATTPASQAPLVTPQARPGPAPLQTPPDNMEQNLKVQRPSEKSDMHLIWENLTLNW